jgi:NADPH:quinone reductase-like Zn-dependent oxidoreductase
MDQTCHQGVDVVLNSLAGELLHTSWRCVARFGKMIELGKRDMLGHAKLDMVFFAGNRSFIGVDIMQILEMPDKLRRYAHSFRKFNGNSTDQSLSSP